MDPRRKPVARGDLGRSPLARVLLGISRRALDGTLVLWPDGGHGSPDRLRFEGGRFTAAYLVAGGRPESFHALFERRAGRTASGRGRNPSHPFSDMRWIVQTAGAISSDRQGDECRPAKRKNAA